jgi:hypothetical protein
MMLADEGVGATQLVITAASGDARVWATARGEIHLDARELVTGVALTDTLRNPAPLTVSIGDTVGVHGKVEICRGVVLAVVADLAYSRAR